MILKRFLLLLFLCFMLLSAANGEIVTLPADNPPGIPCDFDQYGTDSGYEDPSISVAMYSGKAEDTGYLYAIVQIVHMISSVPHRPIRLTLDARQKQHALPRRPTRSLRSTATMPILNPTAMQYARANTIISCL